MNKVDSFLKYNNESIIDYDGKFHSIWIWVLVNTFEKALFPVYQNGCITIYFK